MVTTVTPSSDLRNRALPGEGLDGVVRVASNGYYGTGVLLYILLWIFVPEES